MSRRSIRARRLFGIGVLGTMLLLAVCAPWIAPDDPRQAAPDEQLQGPSRDHLFGTDLLGRDVWSRVLYGGRYTLRVAGLAMLVTLLPGAAIGLMAGYAARWIDGVLMTFMDALLAFPNLLLALALLALLDNGLNQIALVVGIAGIPVYARVTRAAVIEARGHAYVQASQALGAGPGGILWRHILPASAPTLMAFAGVTTSWAILNGAALTFLGYGGDISAPDWGVMLNDGRQVFRIAPWVALAPGAALSLGVLAINVLVGSLGRRPRSR